MTLGGPISAAAVVTDGWTSGRAAAEWLSLASRLECCGWWCNIRSAEGGGNVEAASLPFVCALILCVSVGVHWANCSGVAAAPIGQSIRR